MCDKPKKNSKVEPKETKNISNYKSLEGWDFPYALADLPHAINKKRTLHMIDDELVVSERGVIIKRGEKAAELIFDKLRAKIVETDCEFTYSDVNNKFRVYRYHKLFKEGKSAKVLYNEIIAKNK
jgi:hypothetical protein